MLPAKTPTPAPVGRLPTVAFGPFAFDRQAQILRNGGAEIPLPPRVLGVLDLLVARAGEIVPRQELIDAVWRDAFVTDTSLAEAISFLRQTLGDEPQSPTYVQTVHRRGYRFVAPVHDVEPAITAFRVSPGSGPARDDFPTVAGHLIPWTIAALSLGLAASAVWWHTHVRPVVPPVVRLAIDTSPGTGLDVRAPALALAPDGSRVAWSACSASGCSLYLRPIDDLAASPVAGSEDASAPFFSPDGRWVGFFAGGKLKKVAIAGGSPVTLTDAPQTYGAAWLDDGRIVFAASAYGGLLAVSDRGGEPAALTQPDARNGELRHAWPAAIAGGRAIVFTIASSPLAGAPARIAILADPAAKPAGWRTLVDGADAARPAGRDHLVLSRGDELHAVYFDAARLRTAGPEPLVQSGIAAMQFTVSESGALAYAARPASRGGSFVTGLPDGSRPAMLDSPALSPDHRRLAGVGADGAASDIWVAEVQRGPTSRVTHGGINVMPAWSGDAGNVFFATQRNGSFEIWRSDLAGSSLSRVLARPGRHVFPTSISRDNRLMAIVESGGPTRADIDVVPLDGGAPIASVKTPFDEAGGALSGDGRLLAYQSDESGRWQIYLMTLADKHRLAVSTKGGTHPFWDGDLLYFVTGDELGVVTVDNSGAEVSPVRTVPLNGRDPFAMTDLLFARFSGEVAPGRAVITLEWLRELRQKIGAPVTLPR